MIRYVLSRILSVIFVLIGISLVAFLLGILSPGDPAELALSQGGITQPSPEQIEAMRQKLGLDAPVHVQYVSWIRNAVRGDLGTSYASNQPVLHELARRMPVTLKLAAASLLLAGTLGLLTGTLSAVRSGRPCDRLLRGFCNATLSLPSFWIALLLILLFGEILGWLPTSGTAGLRSMVMPTVVLSSATAAMTARLVRSSLLAEFSKPYFAAAAARGVSNRQLVVRNALPNALLPAMTMLGNYFGGILGGSVIVENIFALPGIGSLAISAIYARDYPVLQGYVLFTGFIYVMIALAVDLLSAVLNPRIRLSGRM